MKKIDGGPVDHNHIEDSLDFVSDWPCLGLPEISQIFYDGSMVFKKDRYDIWDTVEGEWLNGKPHGVCIVDRKKTRGVVTFTKGKRHGGP